ncbi:DUF4043 family protein [Luteolibacter pohnpeiensis]|uniref:DUF4043 family protein n=1 Tax=Luteolibacter pohnpeiensis TaxID=454153 RepID=A0A934S8B3_9BACT|nr:DUF4043 family protein [Luteolibacter pohnpeiensis]MBK1883663.1 DUF4043 family protein [Luteolibacter pohnpeiensis]
MPNVDFTPVNTGDSLAAMDPGSVRKLWQQGVLVAEQSSDFFQEMESRGNKAIIQVKTDTSKGKGQEITFTNMSGFYDEPHIGEELFSGPDDFEETQISSYSLKVDWARHGYSFSDRTEEVMGMRGEIKSGANVELGKWLGRLKTDQLFGMFQLKLNSSNVLYANGKTLNTLGSADTLVWDEIVTGGQSMKPLGGLPANIAAMGSRAPIWSQNVIATEAALTSLKMDPDYRQVLSQGDNRGKGNTLFAGGYPCIDGHCIVPYNPIDHDGIGAVGSFLNPKAFLGTAVAAGTTAIDITGGGNATDGAKTKKMYFKHFPGFAYRFIGEGTFAPATETRYFLIYNLTGADAGKVGMYSYTTGNNGNKITITGRLGSAASGIRATSLGDVTWDTGVWSGRHTDAHPSGSLIIPCNSKGVPIGDTLILGRQAALRGYGKYRGHRSQQVQEGGFIVQNFITSVFGQKIREDRIGRHPSVIRIRHAITYAGINLPTVA